MGLDSDLSLYQTGRRGDAATAGLATSTTAGVGEGGACSGMDGMTFGGGTEGSSGVMLSMGTMGRIFFGSCSIRLDAGAGSYGCAAADAVSMGMSDAKD